MSQFEMSIRFNSPIQEVREAAEKALKLMGVARIRWTTNELQVAGILAEGFWSIERRLTVRIEETGKIRIRCESGPIPFGYARDEDRAACRRFLSTLAQQHKGQSLLRPSCAPEDASTELLRAVVSQPAREPELLRTVEEAGHE
jgi:hypothetical protein